MTMHLISGMLFLGQNIFVEAFIHIHIYMQVAEYWLFPTA